MVDLTLGWMRPTAASYVLFRGAEKLNPDYVEEPPQITEPVPQDFWGAVVITYEAGRVVAIEKRELQ